MTHEASGPGPQVPGEPYPLTYEVDYPLRLGRVSTFLRGILIIPAWLFASIISYILFIGMFAGWIAVFTRRKYPDWLFAAVTGGAALNARLWAYGTLLSDRFPSYESAGSPVHLTFDPPPNGQLSRWRVFIWKYVLILPQAIVLGFLFIAVFVVVVIAWFAILFTGSYPRGMFAFVSGAQRWYFRIFSYLASFHDRYPPYSLSQAAGPGSSESTVANGVIGGLLAGGATTGIIIAAVIASGFETEDVNYTALVDGTAVTEAYLYDDLSGEVLIQLTGATDPADDLLGILNIPSGHRAIVFEWQVVTIGTRASIEAVPARLDYSDGGEQTTISSLFVAVEGVIAPTTVTADGLAELRAVFIAPEGAVPSELRWRPGIGRGFRYILHNPQVEP